VKGQIEKGTNITMTDKKLKNLLPSNFRVLDIIVAGRKVICDMKELMRLANTDNPQEVTSALNKSTSRYYYFGRVTIDLDEEVDVANDDLEIFLAEKMSLSKYDKHGSDTAKRRKVIVDYQEKYLRLKKQIRVLTKFQKYAKLAKNSLEKNIDVLRSINSTIKKGEKGGLE